MNTVSLYPRAIKWPWGVYWQRSRSSHSGSWYLGSSVSTTKLTIPRVGWGALCVGKLAMFLPLQFYATILKNSKAGGGAYYFAKQSINADRQARYEADMKRRRMQESLEYTSNVSSKPSIQPSIASSMSKGTNGGLPRNDNSGSPSQEASTDPAPTRHAPESEGQRVMEKSKYEASEPFRAKKGDRFSWSCRIKFLFTGWWERISQKWPSRIYAVGLLYSMAKWRMKASTLAYSCCRCTGVRVVLWQLPANASQIYHAIKTDSYLNIFTSVLTMAGT